MSSKPRAEGALEACAREIGERIRFLPPSFGSAKEMRDTFLAIMRRHGLRGPDEHTPMCLVHNASDCPFCRTTQEARAVTDTGEG